MKLICSLFRPAVFAMAGVIAAALFPAAGMAADEAKIHVLATFAPIYCFTKNVAGETADVQQLLPPGAEPHDFALSPADLRKLAKADVVVENGLGVEAWLEGALKSSHAARIVASDGIFPDDGNPHVWMDPLLAIREVETIRKGLATRDPAHAEIYARNAAAFTQKLRDLDTSIRTMAESLPDKRLITFHDAFHYFAKRYGFEVVGVFEEFPGREPTPRALKQLRETIQQKNVKVLFAEPQQSPQILRSLSRELNRPIVEIDPMELGEPGAGLYEEAMRSNLNRLKEALGGSR